MILPPGWDRERLPEEEILQPLEPCKIDRREMNNTGQFLPQGHVVTIKKEEILENNVTIVIPTKKEILNNNDHEDMEVVVYDSQCVIR